MFSPIELSTLVLISLLIGFLALDTTIAFQTLISQPIFSGGILGAVLGDFSTGIELGILMQLLWINIIPAGAAVFPEGNLASMVTCAIVLLLPEMSYPNLLFTLAFIIGIAVSYWGALLTVLDRKLNGKILNLAIRACEEVQITRIQLLDIVSVLIYFLLMSALAFCAILIGSYLFTLLSPVVPQILERALIFVKPILWGIGLFLTGQLFVKSIVKQ
ncbi:MAG: hypothetical protein D6748_03785 [Calditrichaeota bacterium]|nr:MAG: hypothetical protein D6748_03785 [Calditrichota bacterium]